MNSSAALQKLVIPVGCAVLFSCTDTGAVNAVAHPVTQPDTAHTDTVVPADVNNPFDDSLRTYFANPLDFYAVKKAYKSEPMHSGGSRDMNPLYYHTVSDSDAQFYGYWAVEFDMRKDLSKRSLLFATQKPWRTPEQRYYDTDNETLVGIRSSVEWNMLGPSNFVGTPIDSVIARFGEPHHRTKTTYTWYQDDHLLVMDADPEKVSWFKYYWWHQAVVIDSLPAAVFSWSDK